MTPDKIKALAEEISNTNGYDWDDEIVCLANAYLELEAKNKVLAEALNKHGIHLGYCNSHKQKPFSEKARKEWVHCTCGLQQALQENK